ncbi:hypothetical protein [Allocoleopsis franciscana]|uniref:hypothetical protein n=1 Tax=Allocoleopsis franciscana TaxID=2886352 RepID=UPI0012DFA551|nr:hypothetical protein [Allocoleopsis franciscana]
MLKIQIYFCEDIQRFRTTGELLLFKHGIILRLRKNQDNPNSGWMRSPSILATAK